ncbi:MAG: hypothetical protein GEU28_12145 [Dehalococcoidia bacterium]|nr:hypothetical protein [Dehalococcoidia bacterium]
MPTERRHLARRSARSSSTTSTAGHFVIGRDGRLHDAGIFEYECRVGDATAIAVSSFAEVSDLGTLVKIKACLRCCRSSPALTVYWRRWADGSG